MRSDIFSTIVQLFSRILLADVVAPNVIEAQQHWILTTMVVSWCLVELIRYPYYFLGLIDVKPPALLGWLRYSAFWALYPTGGAYCGFIVGSNTSSGTSEAVMIGLGLPWFKKTKFGTVELPNAHNFGFDMHLFLTIFMASYVIGTSYDVAHF